jgi:hypothetical protein
MVVAASGSTDQKSRIGRDEWILLLSELQRWFRVKLEPSEICNSFVAADMDPGEVCSFCNTW